VTIHLCGPPEGPSEEGRTVRSALCLALLPVGVADPAGSPRPLVRSYRTVSPLPVPGEPGHRRSAFCCPVREVAPRLALASTVVLWSPDLPQPAAPRHNGPRSPGGLTVGQTLPRHPPGLPRVTPAICEATVGEGRSAWVRPVGQAQPTVGPEPISGTSIMEAEEVPRPYPHRHPPPLRG
jgi:hypothetical protein